MEPPPDWAGLYILDDEDNPVPCYDTITWGRWLEANYHRKRVAQDYDEGDPKRQIRVSTVFLGCDHSFGSGPPLLYETMVFHGEAGDSWDDLTRRYHTKEEALKGHQEVCQIVTQAIRASAKELPHQ